MMISENETRPVTPDPSLMEECSDRHNISGRHIKYERETKGMTLRQLASKAKVSYSELSRIENGKNTATPSTLRKLSPYLSIPMDILLLEAGYNFQTDEDGPVYVDLNGTEINLEEKSLKIYSRNVDFFFQLDSWIGQCSDEDIELVSKFLQIIERKNYLKQNSDNTSQPELCFFKFYEGIQSFVQAVSSL